MYNQGDQETLYSVTRIGIVERLKRFLFKKYLKKSEQRQKEIIREMVTSGKDAPVAWL